MLTIKITGDLMLFVDILLRRFLVLAACHDLRATRVETTPFRWVGKVRNHARDIDQSFSATESGDCGQKTLRIRVPRRFENG